MIYREIDDKGYYLQDVNLHRNIDSERYIEQNWTEGLYKPRWSKTQNIWIEGMDKAELEKMLAVQKLRGKINRAKGLIRKGYATPLGEHWKIHLLQYIKEYWKEIRELEIE